MSASFQRGPASSRNAVSISGSLRTLSATRSTSTARASCVERVDLTWRTAMLRYTEVCLWDICVDFTVFGERGREGEREKGGGGGGGERESERERERETDRQTD